VILLSYVIIDDMQSACVALVLGTTLAEIAAFSIHGLLYLCERKGKRGYTTHPDRALIRRLLPITVPTALSAYMRSALVTVEHLLIPYGLERSGASRDISLAAYGTVHSVVFPLVLFPSAISSAFAGLLVPEISESDAAGDKARIERIACRVLKTVLLYSIGVAGIMICLANEMGSVLFEASDTAKYIAIIAPLIPIMYLDTSVDSILKGLGHQLYSMVVNIADASLSVVLVWILLPRFGIMGYMITVYFTEIVNAALSIVKLLSATRVKVRSIDWIVKPLICIIAATVITARLLTYLGSFATSRAELFAHIALIGVIYIALLFLCRALSFKKIKRSVKNFFK
jgi:stage V sporulation protein B